MWHPRVFSISLKAVNSGHTRWGANHVLCEYPELVDERHSAFSSSLADSRDSAIAFQNGVCFHEMDQLGMGTTISPSPLYHGDVGARRAVRGYTQFTLRSWSTAREKIDKYYLGLSSVKIFLKTFDNSSYAGDNSIDLISHPHFVKPVTLSPLARAQRSHLPVSRMYNSPLWSGVLETVTDITKFVQVDRATQDIYEEAGLGGSADVFSGTYINQGGNVTKVAIKCIRPFRHDTGKSDNIQIDRIQKVLDGGVNIIELIGIMNGIGPLPAFVCELCPWNLQDVSHLGQLIQPLASGEMTVVLQLVFRKENATTSTYQNGTDLKMTDTLRGLSYMHDFETGPIAHGDIKLVGQYTIETALICDFGRSTQPHDGPNEVIVSGSSPFAGTVRYMSPELFVPELARPSPAADMWAYGCIALEILCRLQPYHGVSSDILISKLIRGGHPPSSRPHGPRGSLINDTLWNVLSSCWAAQDWRPTAQLFLEKLTLMLQSGEIPSSPIPMDVFSGFDSESIPSWPSEIKDFDGKLEFLIQVSTSLRATVWAANLQNGKDVAIKVPRLGVRHRNIIDLLGITSEFSPHEGIVFESCFRWNLVTVIISVHLFKAPPKSETPSQYVKENPVIQEEYTLRKGPMENISIDSDGTAKISLFSFGRVLATLPSGVGATASIGLVLSPRWMSPELLVTDQQPTTESDMWAVGCICYWILTGMKPYATFSRDDFAGVESIGGRPPATLASVYHRYTWITNGIWSAIAGCWKHDPLFRTSARDFLDLLKSLEGRKIPWLPTNVIDFAGKIRADSSQYQQNNTSLVDKIQYSATLTMARATYTPKWYSKTLPIRIKRGHGSNDAEEEALISTIQHEITLMAGLKHPCIHQLLGVDSSPTHIYKPDMVFEACGHIVLHQVGDLMATDVRVLTINQLLNQEQIGLRRSARIVNVASALVYLHEHADGPIAHGDIKPENIYVLPNGSAKLANFTCSFQYISGQASSSGHLSSTITISERSSLYCAPEYYNRGSGNERIFPTFFGDIWSFGTVTLMRYPQQLFSRHFRYIGLDHYVSHLFNSKASLDLRQVAPDCDTTVRLLLSSILQIEPQSRPTASTLLGEVSKLSP
ncbi:Pkinase domain-containing protein [Rhizoctonia solani AG-1 IA]|uniref:Pkinase domain-containing protein n=1 Tax=Thanatephorus cucumeris (strain AG1-IA) TaxID=983506 RepID=L8WIM2_THACA|nr:Pkinase domain-containing protein [Rhizoctonia solani AG-1 IA]